MTDIDLDAIEARANAATDGPWEPERYFWKRKGYPFGDCWAWGISDSHGEIAAAVDDLETTEANAAFIAHARTDVPALVREVRRLRDTLRVISEWDAINPPPNDGSDLPWLRRVVDGAFPGGAPATGYQHIVADRDEARAAIARVRALHHAEPDGDREGGSVCAYCWTPWPCPTATALDGAS